jgi:hypothetical protein|tara:strand:- start:635 stop:820 length:186 start_codon:yes stop_codon:yes gene_type:complete
MNFIRPIKILQDKLLKLNSKIQEFLISVLNQQNKENTEIGKTPLLKREEAHQKSVRESSLH